MRFLSLWSSTFSITSVSFSDRFLRHCSGGVAMVVVTVFFESLWSTSIRLSSTLLSLSRCGLHRCGLHRCGFIDVYLSTLAIRFAVNFFSVSTSS